MIELIYNKQFTDARRFLIKQGIINDYDNQTVSDTYVQHLIDQYAKKHQLVPVYESWSVYLIPKDDLSRYTGFHR